MMKRIGTVLLTLGILSLTGCVSIMSRSEKHREPVPYPGVQADNEFIGMAWNETSEFGGLARLESLFFIFDWPFSCVVDTLCLPYDLVRVAGHQETDQPPQATGRSDQHSSR